MCWFSAEHAHHVEQAQAGQRLAIRAMNWHANWVVRETELATPRPCPVCVEDRTKVLFRLSESQQESLLLGAEEEATFKMIRHPKMDIFEFSESRQIRLSDLPSGLVFDVLVVPGLEELSSVLQKESSVPEQEYREERESFLVRLWHASR